MTLSKQRVRVRSVLALAILSASPLPAYAQEPLAQPEQVTVESASAATSEQANQPLNGESAPAEPAPLPPSEATPDDGEPAGYRELVSQAVSEYTAQNFEEARALFVQAHTLFPNARTLRGLGMVEFERRNYLACIAHLEQALSTPLKPLDHALRAETEALLARAKTFVGSVEISVTPSSAHLSIDGAPASASSQRVMLQVGEHSFEIHAAGYIAQRQTISVRGAESQRLSVRLEPLARTDDGQARVEKKTWLKSPWVWIGAGAVLAAVGVSMAIAMRPEAKTNTKTAEPEMTDHSTGVILQALREHAR